jgi:hypothetical protein
MSQITPVTSTSTQTMPTPKVRDWLGAIPNVQTLPVTDIIRAGFSKPEQAYVVDYLKAQVAKAEAARLTARTLIVPATASREWEDDEFHVIATTGTPRHAMHVSPTDPERRQLDTISVKPTDHPVHTAKVGDTWSFELDGEQTPVYEYVGRFRRIGAFKDTDTEWKQYVIREVTA